MNPMALLALFNLMRKGVEVADPALWKNRQITGSLLAGVLMAALNVAAAYGINVPIDIEMANRLGEGFLVVYNVVLTLITSKRVGVGSGQ